MYSVSTLRTTTTALFVFISSIAALSLPFFAEAASFYYTFNSNGVLNEAGTLGESSSPYFWLNSGGAMPITGGYGGTLRGDLSPFSVWRSMYASANPEDTDNGLHPQNIFRLITRNDSWQSVRTQAYFKIEKDNLSTSPNRNGSNGLLLFSHYNDSADTYYAGIRVDGDAVIKKKMNGVYYTIAETKLFPGTYNHDSAPNLLPKNTWIGLRSETVNNTNGTVTVRLYTNIGGTWVLRLTAIDNGSGTGGSVLPRSGASGIRTDFMDVQFDSFSVVSL